MPPATCPAAFVRGSDGPAALCCCQSGSTSRRRRSCPPMADQTRRPSASWNRPTECTNASAVTWTYSGNWRTSSPASEIFRTQYRRTATESRVSGRSAKKRATALHRRQASKYTHLKGGSQPVIAWKWESIRIENRATRRKWVLSTISMEKTSTFNFNFDPRF